MKPHAPDPHSKPRAYWRRWRFWAWWVLVQYRALSATGFLGRDGAPQWLPRALDALELGLRSLLIIGARGVKPAPSSRFVIPDAKRLGIQLPFSPEASFVDGSPDGCAVGNDAKKESASKRKQPAFSLSLKDFEAFHQLSSRFGGAAVETGTHSSTFGETGEVGPRICDAQARLGGDDKYGCGPVQPGLRRDERLQIEQRLAAIFDVFTNPDAYIARMARRLARRGIKLKRTPATRPSSVAQQNWREPVPTSSISIPAIADSS